MKTISGSKNTAIVYTTSNRDTMIDSYAVSQIENLCSLDVLKNSKIRIMPDVHAGKVCPIGFTATLQNGIMPILIGIDIGCGISIMRITRGRPDWNRLDSVISGGAARPGGGAAQRIATSARRLFLLPLG